MSLAGRWGPVTFGSVHHGSLSTSSSVVRLSSSPPLLLPLFFFCPSSDSIAIKELRRDPNAASSVIKTVSREDGLCHLNCLFRAHVTPNSPCVAGLSEDINSYRRVWCNDPYSQLVHRLSLLFMIQARRRDKRHIADSVWSQLHAAHETCLLLLMLNGG